MSHPQAHIESKSGGFLDEIVIFVVIVVEAARDWVASLWAPPVPISEATQAKDGTKEISVAPPQGDSSSTTPNIFSGSDTGALGNTEDSSILLPIVTDSAGQSLPTRDLDDNHAIKAEQSKDEVPLIQDANLGQAEPTADIHEIAVENSSPQEWVSLSKSDAESLSSIKASDVQPEVPPQPEDPQAEGSSSQEPESTLESTLIDAPILNEATTTSGSDTSSPLLSTPEPDTQSFDNAAVRIPTDAEATLNPESNVEAGELKSRKSNPSLSDSSSINGGGAAGAELPTKKKRGGSFIKRQTTLMSKVFKSKQDGPTNLTSPSKGSLTLDNQSITSSLVAEPEATAQSTPATDVSSADTPSDKKFTSPSRVSIGSISSMSGSIKKKFRKNSTASDKVIASAVGTPEQESRSDISESLDLSSSSSQASKVADATSSGPSLLKTMFKVRKPLKLDESRT